MDRRDHKRDSYNGFGDGLARAFELAFTPTIFGAIGYGLDSLFGIRPVLTIALGLFAICGMFVRLWYGYDLEMRKHETSGPFTRPTQATVPAATVAAQQAAGRGRRARRRAEADAAELPA